MRKPIHVTGIIDTTPVVRESREQRLAKLKQYKEDELKSDNPSSLYIADLDECIVELEGNQ